MLTCLEDADVDKVDYVALADGLTLEPVELVTDSTVALVAAFVDNTRLIDNMPLAQRFTK